MGCHFLLQCMKMKLLSRVRLLETPWTAAHQAPPSMGFSRQEYWSGVPLPSTLQRCVQIVTLATLEYLEIGSLQTKLYSILELGGPLIE